MRAVALFLVCFQVLFLNVFLPAHTRGAITMAETRVAATGGGSCCSVSREGGETKKTPTSEERRCCAVCYVASAFIPVDPIVTVLELREAIELAHEQAVAQVRSVEFPMPFWPAGPPAAPVGAV